MTLREKAREMACRIPDDQPGTPVSARCEHAMRVAMAAALEWAGGKTESGGYRMPDQIRAEAARLRAEVKP